MEAYGHICSSLSQQVMNISAENTKKPRKSVFLLDFSVRPIPVKIGGSLFSSGCIDYLVFLIYIFIYNIIKLYKIDR
jgi:hypothetical protein